MVSLEPVRPILPDFSKINDNESYDSMLRDYLQNLQPLLSSEKQRSHVNSQLRFILTTCFENANENSKKLIIVKNIFSLVKMDWAILLSEDMFSFLVLLLERVQLLQINKTIVKSNTVPALPAFLAHVYDQFSTFSHDKYGSLLLRNYLYIMSGLVPKSLTDPSQVKKKGVLLLNDLEDVSALDKEVKDHLQVLCQTYLRGSSAREEMEHEFASPCIQTLMAVSAKRVPDCFVKCCKSLVKRKCHLWSQAGDAVNFESEQIQLPASVQHSICSHIVEQLIGLLPPDLLLKCYERHLSGKELHYAIDGHGEFIIYRLIVSVPSDNVSWLSKLLNKFSPHMGKLLARGCWRPIQAFVEQSLNVKSIQGNVTKLIRESVLCHTPANEVHLFAAILCLSRFEEGPTKKKSLGDEPHHVGSFLLQRISNFKHSNAFVESLLNTSDDLVKKWSCDAIASHAVEAFLTSKKVTNDSKLKIANKLATFCYDLALDTYGSHIMESLWNLNRLDIRELLVKKLSSKYDGLRNHAVGKFIALKYAPGHYAKNPQQWRNLYGLKDCVTTPKASDKSDNRKRKMPTQQQKNNNKKKKIPS